MYDSTGAGRAFFTCWTFSDASMLDMCDMCLHRLIAGRQPHSLLKFVFVFVFVFVFIFVFVFVFVPKIEMLG